MIEFNKLIEQNNLNIDKVNVECFTGFNINFCNY